MFAGLRDSLDPWVRFRATATLVQGGPPWRLHARTPDGLWAASAAVERNFGVAKERVPLLLESRARLVGVVRDPSGAALAGGYVAIEREGASFSDESNHPLLGLIEADGHYTIPCAPPGEYTVKFDRDSFLPFRGRVALTAGATTEFELVLESPPPSTSGRVEARLESVTGRFEGVVYPYLRPAGTKSGSRRAAVKWNDEHGARVGQLIFEDVPLGDWDLGLQVPGFVQLEQRELRVRPHDPPLVFRILDDIWTLAPLDILAFDEQGSALDGFLAVLSVKAESGEASARERAESGRAHLAAAPVGVRARLKLTKDGWQPSWSEVDLTAEARELRFTLKPGWGIEVVVRGPDGTGLRGAKVFFDGELSGETDADGLLFVARGSTPATASVEYLDWVRTEKSGLNAEGRFRNFEPWLVVGMQPPAR